MKKINHEKFVGQRFGKVVVTSFSHSEKRDKKEREYYFYNYKCDCGNEGVTGKHTLLQAKDYSCKACRGVDLGIRSKVSSKKYDDPVEAKCSIVYSNYKSRAKRKGWGMSLNFEEFKNLVTQDCHYCGLEPKMCRMDRAKSRQGLSRVYFNGIDRLDSMEGYTLDNSVTCCEDCNKAKRNLSPEQFLELVRRIFKHQERGAVDSQRH